MFGCAGSSWLPGLASGCNGGRCGGRTTLLVGFPFRWPLFLGSPGSRVQGLQQLQFQGLEQRLSGCGTGSYLLCGMWDLTPPGIEPMSPVLAGRFFITELPGKPKKPEAFKKKSSSLFRY